MTHKEKVLALLADKKPHSHMEGYRLGVMLHSRVADLRKDGHQIECWRDGDNYLYRLVSLAGATCEPSAPLSSPGRNGDAVAPASESRTRRKKLGRPSNPSDAHAANVDHHQPVRDGGSLQLALIEAA